MTDENVHKCDEMFDEGISIHHVFIKGDSPTRSWELVISLQEDPWDATVEITFCPFCGKQLSIAQCDKCEHVRGFEITLPFSPPDYDTKCLKKRAEHSIYGPEDYHNCPHYQERQEDLIQDEKE